MVPVAEARLRIQAERASALSLPRAVREQLPPLDLPLSALTTMSGVFPTIEQIEDYMESLEELLFSSLQAATPDLPRVSEAIHRLWEDVSRFGPQSLPPLPDLHIPGLGAFEVPPPPPPPPPPPAQSFLRHTASWVADHPWTTAGITVGAVGTGLLVGYGYYHAGSTTVRVRATASPDRRQVVGEYCWCFP